jgi:FixJ family two-component response regulator
MIPPISLAVHSSSCMVAGDCKRLYFTLERRIADLPRVPVISIIDDDESVRVATRSLVRSLGFTAHTFASAEEFLHSSLVNDSACVITDVQMPGLSGVELQSRLLAQGYNTPIIFITAFPDESVEARAMKAGAICFLSKPFDGPTLIRYLDAALQRRNGTTAEK